MFSRILKICSDKETRTPFTHIWFLPSDNINEISKCLEQLMKEDNILKKYNDYYKYVYIYSNQYISNQYI